jgi:hypothetical protein
MQVIPSLPAQGPLRLLAISGSIALLAFLCSAIVVALRARRQPAGSPDRAGALWAAASFAMLLVAFALGRLAPTLHPVASAATFVLAARNTWKLEGPARLLQALGLLAYLIAILAARALFGR